eukprot:CAMPEP_0118921886 /NCGR_PEP_ID=MMETSP1169-20130426/1021_1 /TAXON_ID=36882 /ORGANISM="Pyramimonas obovata, Strain CCMP722" /LENGTH=132 /DNA_ID=CAMNT_0006862681 /DNA_START=72 /DNA_END=470 /DNA_ORIENTATION=+
MAAFAFTTTARIACVSRNVSTTAAQKSVRQTSTSARPVKAQPLRFSKAAPQARRVVYCQAEPTEGEKETAPPSAPAEGAPEEAPEAPGLKKGQGTAIATGAVAIILGGLYLYAASILDSRELLPPPPEALGL